jgi:tetratricopeptide (TPR) repeat protein
LHFAKAVQLKPNSAPAVANLAVNLARLGKNDRAEAEFKKAVEIEPDNFDANHDFGEFYVRSGNLPAAIPYLERAQRADPSSYENGYDLALAYEQTVRLTQARQQIQELLSRKDTAELHNLLAGVDEKAGDYVAAANEYERAAHLDPSESNLFDWGSELLLHQTVDPAVEVFSQGLERHPNSPRLAVGLGLALFLRGSYDQAVKALLRATDLTLSDPRAYYFLSKAYDMSPSQADEVIQHFQRFAQLQPRNAQAAYYYGMSLWKGKQTGNSGALLNQVESLLKKAVSLDPSFTDARLQLGNLYSQERRYAEAVPEYQHALQLDPNIPDAHYRLGQAYVHLGQKDLAQKEFEVHQQLYKKHLAEVDERRSKILQFIYSMKQDHTGS